VFIYFGANIGLHSLQAAEIGYEVFAFEPDPITFKFLELNGTINGLQVKARMIVASLANIFSNLLMLLLTDFKPII
jgi:FkbM family methyltransferase